MHSDGAVVPRVIELVVHGDDLARVTGLAWDPGRPARLIAVSALAEFAPEFVDLTSGSDAFGTLTASLRTAPALDIPTTVKAFMVVSDGMFWRRAVDPSFNPAAVMPAVLQLIRALLNPVTAPTPDNNNQATQ